MTTHTMPRRRRRQLGPAALLAVTVALSACSGGDDDLGSATTSIESTTTLTEPTSTSSSTTASTTTASTTSITSTTTTTLDPDEELRDELMASIEGFWETYVACLVDSTTCDVESSLGSMIDHPLRGDLDAAMAEWAADGLQFESDEEIVYRRHDLALPNPETYAVEVCLESSHRDIFTVAADGTRSPLDQEPPPDLVRLQQFALESRGDEFIIVLMQSNRDETVEGDSCDAYREG